jgi:hypothetical protein
LSSTSWAPRQTSTRCRLLRSAELLSPSLAGRAAGLPQRACAQSSRPAAASAALLLQQLVHRPCRAAARLLRSCAGRGAAVSGRGLPRVPAQGREAVGRGDGARGQLPGPLHRGQDPARGGHRAGAQPGGGRRGTGGAGGGGAGGAWARQLSHCDSCQTHVHVRPLAGALRRMRGRVLQLCCTATPGPWLLPCRCGAWRRWSRRAWWRCCATTSTRTWGACTGGPPLCGAAAARRGAWAGLLCASP